MSSPLPRVSPSSTVPMPNVDYGTFVPGGTQYHKNAWLTLTHDPFVINNINGVEIDLKEIPHQEAVPGIFLMSEVNRGLLTTVVKEHLDKGIIEICTPT